MKQTDHLSPPSVSASFWYKRNGLIYIGPQSISPAGYVREVIAYLALAASIGLMAVGLRYPAQLGLTNNQIVYLAGPAMIIAALIHLIMVISAVRGAWAVVGAGGIKLPGRTIKWSQVHHPRVEHLTGQGLTEPSLVLDLTTDDNPDGAIETLPLVPAGMTDEADLRRLMTEIRAFTK